MRSDFLFSETGKNALMETGSLALQTLIYGFGFVPHRHQTVRSRELHTVVFVHGLAANRASLFPVQAYLRARGFKRQHSVSYTTVGSIEAMAVQLKQRIDEQVKGGRIDLVCHSLGGLVARTYLQMLGGDRRVSRVVTLGTPHLGTHATAYLPTPMVRQMTPDSPFLTYLNSLPAPEVEFTSLGANADAIVLPTRNARAPFGDYEGFDSLGHTSMLLSPSVLRRVGLALGPCEERLRTLQVPPVLDGVVAG